VSPHQVLTQRGIRLEDATRAGAVNKWAGGSCRFLAVFMDQPAQPVMAHDRAAVVGCRASAGGGQGICCPSP
jgi:hypothetical protein